MRALCVWLTTATLASAAPAQEPFKPGKLPKDEVAALAPGLRMTLDASGATDVKRVRLAALHVPAGAPASPFLPPGPFSATFAGYIKAPIRSEYGFRVLARGSATLFVNDVEVARAENGEGDSAAPTELARGYNRVKLVFRAPAKGDATVRVSWVGEGFEREPLPPDALFVRGDDAALTAGDRLREGRLTFATHGCQRCHAVPAEASFPELAHQAPTLDGAGDRFGAAWLAQWIRDPRSLRPKATMPTTLHGPTAPQDAADLAAYLATLHAKPAKAAAKGVVAEGEKLYRRLGCLACHHFGDPQENNDLDLYPLHFASAKYAEPGALEAFLQAPHARHAWSRMPDFRLTAEEAAHLAAFVRLEAKGKVAPSPQGDAARGQKRFAEAGCVQCHATQAGAAPTGAATLAFPKAGDVGCLATSPQARGSAPDFGLTKKKREALGAVVGKADAFRADTPAEFAARQVGHLKCNACHRRDGQTSRWFQAIEDEGTLPENLPLLTWTGEKLRPMWTETLLRGEHDHRARPWLKARMPAFPARAATLAVGLSHEHGFAVDEDTRPKFDAGAAAVGKTLIVQMGGLNCVQCHGIGKTPPTAPFEAPGINLVDAAKRLRHDYYLRWMLDPPRVDPTTKMPKLAADGQRTGIRETFEGDARRQFDALWHYIQSLPAKKE